MSYTISYIEIFIYKISSFITYLDLKEIYNSCLVN